jgi:hypothetical protein
MRLSGSGRDDHLARMSRRHGVSLPEASFFIRAPITHRPRLRQTLRPPDISPVLAENAATVTQPTWD